MVENLNPVLFRGPRPAPYPCRFVDHDFDICLRWSERARGHRVRFLEYRFNDAVEGRLVFGTGDPLYHTPEVSSDL